MAVAQVSSALLEALRGVGWVGVGAGVVGGWLNYQRLTVSTQPVKLFKSRGKSG